MGVGCAGRVCAAAAGSPTVEPMTARPRTAFLPFWPLFAGLCLLAAAAAVLTPLVGQADVSLARALDASIPPEQNPDYLILMTLRIPRTVFGLVAGAALALAGAVFQALLRNDLATPYTLGVSGGATFGALLAIQLAGVGVLSLGGWALMPPAALLGGSISVGVILLIARRSPTADRMATLLLAGVTLNLMFAAGIQVIQYLANPFEVFSMVRWMMGGLYEYPFVVSGFLGAVVAAGFFVLLAHAQALNVMTLGDATAVHLGFDAGRTRFVCLAAASAITALVVAWSGPIGFVGLIIPHAMRRLVGPDHRRLLPCVLVAGAAFLVICDFAGRLIGGTQELPVGIITACLGGPFFLWILFRRGVR